ncbi:MAG: PEP-CTERM sorting domain-containing protein [Pirellulaceae bacterium]
MNRLIFFLLAVLAACSSSAQADLLIEFDNAQFGPNSLGSVDVFVTGPDTIRQYNTTFLLTPVSGQGILEFRSSFDVNDAGNSDRQSNSEVTDGSYVFFGSSRSFNSSVNENDKLQLVQSDISTAAAPPTTRRLLARLELRHVLPVAEIPSFTGAEYRIGLVQNIDQTLIDQTFFRTTSGAKFAPAAASFNNFGTINISSLSAVPEPSSAVLLLCASSVACVWRRRRV